MTLRWNHHLFANSAIRTQLRGYRDSWGVLALTPALEYVVGFGIVAGLGVGLAL